MRKSSYLLIVLLIAARSNAMQNQNSEELRQEAKKGHAESMWLLAVHFFDAGKYKDGQKWMNRYVIRVRQDAACSKDPSVGAARDAVVAWGWTNPEKQQKILEIFPNEEAQ